MIPRLRRNEEMSAIRRDKAKTRSVIALLEEHLGTPHLTRPLPDPLDLLVATVLSQNTNDKNSHRAYTNMKEAYPHWQLVAHAPTSRLVKLLKTGGMASLKAQRIKGILSEVKGRFGHYDLSRLRTWKNERILRELTSIKGVGPKTAACVCVFSLGRDIFPVDTHVHRICGRLRLAGGARTAEEMFLAMRKRIPPGKSYSFHTNLIRFGRTICRSRNPACGDCPIFTLCSFAGKTNRHVRPSPANHAFMVLENVQ